MDYLDVYVYIPQEKLKHHLALLILYDSDTKILSHHLQNYHSDKVVEQIFFDYKVLNHSRNAKSEIHHKLESSWLLNHKLET